MESLCSDGDDDDSSISLATTSEECQHDRLFYEQFGATTLLYRHRPYYTHFDSDAYDCDYPREIFGPNNAESTSSAHRRRHHQGERMAKYALEKVSTFHSEKPWEVTLDTLDGMCLENYASYIADTILHSNKKRLIRQSPIVGKWMGVPYTELERKKAGRISNFTRLRLRVDKNIAPNDNETSESGMKHDPKGHSNDCSTIIGIDRVQEAEKKASIETAKIKLQRMYTSPSDGYGIAPFRSKDIKFGLSLAAEVRDDTDNNDIPLKFQKRQKRLEDNPRFYGNCLKLLPCCCDFCVHANDVKEIEDSESQDLFLSQNTPQISSAHFRSTFLLYPRGQSLAASKINFPMSQKRSEIPHNGRETGNSIVDTGGRILQVELCYDADKTEDDENLKKFAIVRTPTHCSLISCEPRLTKNEGSEKESRVTGCKGEGYILDEISRFDHRTGSRDGFEPFHVAVKHHQNSIYGGSEPSFAVVGREHESTQLGFEGANVIYHAKVQSELSGQRHCIESLASISQIEFSGMNPLVLWASARKKTRERNFYKACNHNYHKRPIMGLGHSLHSIDLRSGHSNFTWSPSHDEYSMNAIHSVSGFAVDSDRQHSLFVSCASASKIYQVDARMPGQTLTSWGLPGLCDDNPSQNSPSGIYGSGMLFSKPPLEKDLNTVPLMVGVSKEPGCPCFHLLQGPSRLGRFQTKVLERTAHSGLDTFGDFASSSSFSLPDVSESSFVSGIAAFYTPLSSISKIEDDIGKALCLISLTAGGDLYSHTLLPSLTDKTGKSNFVSEGPIGSCAIALNDDEECSKEPDYQDFDLQWSTSNTASLPGRSIICNSKKRSFIPSQFCKVPPKNLSRENKRKIVQDVIALSHVNPHKRIVDPVRSQQPHTSLITCCTKDDSQIFMRMPKKERRYNSTAQTDNLRCIINELRSNK